MNVSSSSSASSSGSSSADGDADALVAPDDCSLFTRFCDFNASTSSCVFRASTAFSCAAADCRWELTGDLVLADGVDVALDSDDCALRVSANMLVLGAGAALRATSVSVAAAFVRLERAALVDASFGGAQFRGAATLFPGDANATRGASHGGSGGRRVPLAELTSPAQRAFGAFFDARRPDGETTAIHRRMQRHAARAWDLAALWARADASDQRGDDDQEASRLLLGAGSPGTRGGGRVRVVASRDLVLMPGAAVRANGGDARSGSSGGSGGSVFLSAAALSLGADSSVEARGGHATCSKSLRGIVDCAPGGGGGRVHISYVSSQLDDRAVDVSGGALAFPSDDDDDSDDAQDAWRDRVAKLIHPAEQHALAGAAGTYLRVFRVAKPTNNGSPPASTNVSTAQMLFVEEESTTSEALLVVMNRRLAPTITHDADDSDRTSLLEWVGGGAVTPLEIDANATRRVDSLVVTDGAAVAARALAVGDLELRNGSFLLDAGVCEDDPENDSELAVDARRVVVLNRARVLLPSQSLALLATSLVLDATVELRFAHHVTLAAATSLRIDARVSSPSSSAVSTTTATTAASAPSLALIGGGDVVVGGASIAVGALFIHADGSIAVNAAALDASRAASIDARFQPCDPKRGKKSDPRASPRHVAASFLSFARGSNFTMLLQASQSISIGVPPRAATNTSVLVAGAPMAALSTSTLSPSTAAPQALSPSPEPSLPVSLTASAILLCAENLIELGDAAVVTSNGRGEQANQGPGSGDCVGSVGGGGGYGGRGADSSAVNELGDYASGGLAYGTRSGIGMLGSGGGCVDGGAGGGVIMVGARGVVLDGQVHCNGEGGVQSGGGGSGGFLGLSIADFLKGHGRISAVGGGAQCVELSDNKDLREALEQPLQPGEDVAGNATAVASAATKNAVRNRRLAVDVALEKAVAADTNAVETTKTTTITRVCGGGGGGGRLQLHGCELNDIDKCTRGFDGNYTVAGGATSWASAPAAPPGDGSRATSATDTSSSVAVAAASSGSFVGFPCLPGSGGLFCRVCPPGAFKAESNSEECLPCSNAPSNAHYVGFGATSAACDWACDPGYSGDFCVSPIQQLLDACGGVLGFGVVLLSIVVFLILLGYACRSRKEPGYPRGAHRGRHGAGAGAMDGVTGSKSERQHLLRSAIASTQRSRFACLLRWLYWPRVSYPKLVERDLPEHMARIYLTGMNDRDAPLKLRLTVPPALKSVLYDEEFRELAERINAALAWPTGVFGSWGEVVYRLVVLLCYPAASAVLAYRRHLRLNALKRIVARYNHACMKGPRARGLLNALKLGYSGDYSLVYLELLYKESSQSACVPTTAIGKPSLPIVLLFAGRGTYESPFYLDPSDLLVRSIPQCPELTAFIDEPWVEFVAELNELLRVVNNKDVALVETLLPVAQFLEKKMATATAASVVGASHSSVLAASTKLGGLRIYLGRFYVGDEVDCGEEFKLGILVTSAASESGSNQLSEASMLTASNLQTNGIGNGGGRYAYGGPVSSSMSSYGTSGQRHLDPLDSYARGVDDGHFMFDPMGGSGAAVLRRGSSHGASANNTANPNGPPSHKSTVSSIREEALRIRSNTSGSVDNLLVAGHRLSDFDSPELLHGPRSGRSGGGHYNHRELRRRKRRQTFYEGWLGPVDGSLPVPGVLIAADELEDRLADRTPQQKLEWLVRKHVLPTNVPRSKWLGASWMVHGALLSLLMVDLAITFAMVVNLRCVTDGEVDRECSATILMPVLLLPPLTLFLAPIMGIVSLAIASNAFSRRYAIWNALSMGNVAVAILMCLTQSSRLVAPWFTAPLPLLPVIAMAVKAGEACVVERYIAFQETNRRRRGWRGLMKRRLSDASMPVESP